LHPPIFDHFPNWLDFEAGLVKVFMRRPHRAAVLNYEKPRQLTGFANLTMSNPELAHCKIGHDSGHD